MKTKLHFILFILFAQASFGQFITTWETTRTDQNIIIPTNSDFTYNYNVSWGDGTTSNNQTGDANHTYAEKGTYTVSITGTFPAIYFYREIFNSTFDNNKKNIKTIESWGNNQWKSMRRAFRGCDLLTINATDNPNLTNVSDMLQMFYNASKVNPNTSNWNVSNVTNMKAMFYGAKDFNQDVSNWDVSNVTDMGFMFYNAINFNQNISNWNVSKVTKMDLMFELAVSFNQDISNWDVSSVTDTNRMFRNATNFNQNLGIWNISNVLDMNKMFQFSGLTTNNYDAILTGWSSQNVKQNVTLGAEGINYCNAENARAVLIDAPNNWTINDGGKGTDCSSAETTSIPDSNFEQYLIDENIDSDATINGQVLTADIENIDALILPNKNIANLVGIQDFTNLVELNAANNQISNINLNKNLLLEKLFMANNQLTDVNLSKNIALKNVDVGENQLTEIDVHLLINLESLSIYKNQITEINILSNQNLQALICNNNLITTIDTRENNQLSWINAENNSLENLMLKNGNNSQMIGSLFNTENNPNLTCIEVDDVNYSSTNWTQIDATANFSTDCAPANDECTFAIPLTLGQQTPGDINSGTFTNATDCVAGPIIADVWFTITVPETREFSIEGSGFGGLLKFALYDSCTSASAISCGLNISLTNQTPGTVYYLKVWMEQTNTSSKTLNSDAGTFTIKANESSVLSVNNISESDNDLVLFPNPASTAFTISSASSKIQNIEIYNLLGEKVFNQKAKNTSKVAISTLSFSRGIYLIKIQSDTAITSRKLVIK
ncbi:BspA family leucine-rich repeat surface protein [Polaribacter sp.]|uniref:BspA family leucine-rich repeat surface protein n=1 Tax=Polaribacter sp. TaxID=1920175 RepID=UPI003F6CFF6F